MASGVGVVLGLVGLGSCPWWGGWMLLFRWRCFVSEGPCNSLMWFSVHFGFGCVGLLSLFSLIKIKIKSQSY
jgi:hypothetical protein